MTHLEERVEGRMQETGRRAEVHYWNFIKTISICLVAYCHMPLLNPTWYNNFSQLLTYIAVPVFFMVNGAALFQGSFDYGRHIRKMLHLFLVTRVWRLIYLLFALWYGLIEMSALTPLKTVTYFLGNSIKGIPSGPLWFIRVLLACYLIFPILKLAFDSENGRKYLRLLCIAMLVLMLLRQDLLFLQEGLVARGLMEKESTVSLSFLTRYNPINEWAVLYFILGGLLHQKYFVEKRICAAKNAVLCGIVFLLGSLWFFGIKRFIAGFSGTLFNDFSKYGVDGCYQSLAVCVMTVSLFMLALNLQFKCQRLNSLWKLVGRNTLAVYYVHYVFAYLLQRYVPYFQNHVGIVCNGLKAIVLVCTGLAFGCFAKKIPFLRKIVT